MDHTSTTGGSTLKTLLSGFILLFLVSLRAAAGTDTAPDLDTRLEHLYTTHTLNDDGSHIESHDWALKVLKESAVANAKNTPLTYWRESHYRFEFNHALPLHNV